MGRCDAIICLETEAPVIGGVAEHERPDSSASLHPLQPRADKRTADPLPLPGRRDGQRSEQRDFLGYSGNTAGREDDVPGQRPVGNPDERENGRLFPEERRYKRQQILIGKRFRIKLLNRGYVGWNAFAYFDFVDHSDAPMRPIAITESDNF